MEAQFNDLCRRMLRFEKPSDEVEPDKPAEPPAEEEKPKMSRSERRAQEKREKKKQKKQHTESKKTSNKGISLSEVKTQVRLSQFDEKDKARIEKILFNK